MRLPLGQTPSQTIGPFFGFSLSAAQYGFRHASIGSVEPFGESDAGERIRIIGHVLDGAGEPVDDALVEIWQADAAGRYAQPADSPSGQARGFGRCGTGGEPGNGFAFRTIKPGSADGEQAPHINVILFMRGMLSHAYTRVYFSDEAAANARDPVLMGVPEERRRTLIAVRDETDALPTYRFDIRVQGQSETVFFDV